MSDQTTHQDQKGSYLYVWGDTVLGRRLGLAVIAGIVIAGGSLLAAEAFFTRVLSDPEIGHVWSLLVGIGGCAVAGIIVGATMKPAREIVQTAEDSKTMVETIDALSTHPRGLGKLEQASQQSRDELDAANLTHVFQIREEGDRG